MIFPAASFNTVNPPPFPMAPAPWMVLLTFSSVRPAFCWLMMAEPVPWDSVTVPPPVKVVLAFRPRVVLFAPVAMFMLPLLVMVPETKRLVLLPDE